MSLLEHPGWRRFVLHAKEQWGPVAYARKLKRIITETPSVESVIELRILDKVNDELNALLSYPTDQVRRADQRLEADAAPPDLSRRGIL